MIKKKKNQSYYIRILCIFLIISFAIISETGLIFFQNSRRQINTSFAKKSLLSVNQVSDMFDILHSQMIPGLKEASYNNEAFSKLMFSDDLSDRQLLNGVNLLDDLLLSYPLIHSLCIYNGQLDLFISTTNGLEKYKDFSDKDVLFIVRKFNSDLINSYWPRNATFKNLTKDKILNTPVLTLIMGTIPEDKMPLTGALISNIDVNRLKMLLNTEFSFDSQEFIIVNHRGELICQTNEDSIVDYKELYATVENDLNTEIFKSESNLLVAHEFNDRFGWHFFNVTPLKIVNKEINSMRKRFCLLMLSVTILSLIISYIGSKKLYKPINNLMQVVSDDNKKSFDLPESLKNELGIIANTYLSVVNQKSSLENTLDHLQEEYKIEIFRSIISGETYNYWGEELSEKDKKFLNGSLCMYVVQMDRHYHLMQEMSPKNYQTLRNEIFEIIDGNFSDSEVIKFTMPDHNVVLIMNKKDSDEERKFTGILAAIYESFKQTVTIGCIYRDQSENLSIKDMYSKAKAAVESKFRIGPNTVVKYTNQDESTKIFPGEQADQILSALRIGDIQSAHSGIDVIIENLKSATTQDYIQHTRILCYKLQVFLEYKQVPEIQSLLHQIRLMPQTIEFLKDFKILFYDIVDTIHNTLEEPNRKNLIYYEAIKSNLEQNFMDQNCCVQSIADDLELSMNYIRKIYKKFSNCSLSDAILIKRIEEACRLLQLSSQPVKDIYSQAGFSNYNSFFTCFKKVKGKTPAAYRREKRVL